MLVTLMKKDFRVNWLVQLMGWILLSVISQLFLINWIQDGGSRDPGLVLYCLTVFTSSATLTILFLLMDHYFKADGLIASLPVNRANIVVARYCSCSVHIIVSLLAHFIGAVLGALYMGVVHSISFSVLLSLEVWVILGLTLLLYFAFYLPFYFRYGMVKGLAIVGAIQLLIAFTAFFMVLLFHRHEGIGRFLSSTADWLSNQNSYLLLAVLLGVLFSLYGGSLTFSIVLFKKRDL